MPQPGTGPPFRILQRTTSRNLGRMREPKADADSQRRTRDRHQPELESS